MGDWWVWVIGIVIGLAVARFWTWFMWTSTERDARRFSHWWSERRRRK